MAVEVLIGEMTPVFVAPDNETAKQWGVYSLPVMIRDVTNGELILRVNGHGDNPFPDGERQAEDVFFRSSDQGATWFAVSAEEEIQKDPYRWKHFYGSNERSLQLEDGTWITVAQMIAQRQEIEGIPPLKSFPTVNFSAHLHAHRYCRLPPACTRLALQRVRDGKTTLHPIRIHDPLLEVVAEAGAYETALSAPVKIPEQWKYPCLVSMLKAPDGTLLAAAAGQLPQVKDYLCCGVYLYQSRDGINWTRRGVIAQDHEDGLIYGYDEFSEISMALADNGDLLCVIRTEKCVPKEVAPICGTMFTVSHDLGYTWEKNRQIADSSTMPILTKLSSGVIVLTYGRPGVHMLVTEDHGKSWLGPYSILGNTLTQELEAGRDYYDCKFGDTISYSNVFPVKVGADQILLCTSHQKYDPGDGIFHKASVVIPVSIKKCEDHA